MVGLMKVVERHMQRGKRRVGGEEGEVGAEGILEGISLRGNSQHVAADDAIADII